jgi:hypothetical protein
MMNRVRFEGETFMEIPVNAKVTDDEAVARYLQRVEEAKQKMKACGFTHILEKRIEKRPPKLRRRIS